MKFLPAVLSTAFCLFLGAQADFTFYSVTNRLNNCGVEAHCVGQVFVDFGYVLSDVNKKFPLDCSDANLAWSDPPAPNTDKYSWPHGYGGWSAQIDCAGNNGKPTCSFGGKTYSCKAPDGGANMISGTCREGADSSYDFLPQFTCTAPLPH